MGRGGPDSFVNLPKPATLLPWAVAAVPMLRKDDRRVWDSADGNVRVWAWSCDESPWSCLCHVSTSAHVDSFAWFVRQRLLTGTTTTDGKAGVDECGIR